MGREKEASKTHKNDVIIKKMPVVLEKGKNIAFETVQYGVLIMCQIKSLTGAVGHLISRVVPPLSTRLTACLNQSAY